MYQGACYEKTLIFVMNVVSSKFVISLKFYFIYIAIMYIGICPSECIYTC